MSVFHGLSDGKTWQPAIIGSADGVLPGVGTVDGLVFGTEAIGFDPGGPGANAELPPAHALAKTMQETAISERPKRPIYSLVGWERQASFIKGRSLTGSTAAKGEP